MDGPSIVGMLIGMLFGLAIGALIGGVFLRAAISLYNRMVDRSNSVPEPGFGRAVLISLVAGLAQMIVGFVIGLVMGAGAAASDLGEQNERIATNVVAIPLGLSILAGVISKMLPTTFTRGILVALCELLIAIAIAIVLIAIISAVVLLFR